jgi:hypothetical protein
MSHDESYQAMLLRKQREARKAYSASQELGDETESQVEAVLFVDSKEDDEQAQFLVNEGAWQERVEKAFCVGMMVGGATALTVLMGTLWWLGVV